jgi:hypothetical protein
MTKRTIFLSRIFLFALLAFVYQGRLFADPKEFIDADIDVPEATSEDARIPKTNLENRFENDAKFISAFAEKMIWANIAGNFVEVSPDEDFYVTRSKLVDWIRKNPKRAENLYRMSQGMETQNYTQSKDKMDPGNWKISSHFLNLVNQLRKTAGSEFLSPEEMSYYSRRMFEGKQYHEATLVHGTNKKRNDAPRYSRGNIDSSNVDMIPTDWKLNSSQLFEQKNRLNSNVKALRERLNFDRNNFDRKNDSDLSKNISERDKLLINASAEQSELSSFSTRFSIRRKIQETEATRLQTLVKSLHMAILKAKILERIFTLKIQKEEISDSILSLFDNNDLPDIYSDFASALLSEYSSIYIEQIKLKEKMESETDINVLYANLNELSSREAFWQIKALFFFKLPELKKILEGVIKPCEYESVLVSRLSKKYGRLPVQQKSDEIKLYKEIVLEAISSFSQNRDQEVLATFNRIGNFESPQKGLLVLWSKSSKAIEALNKYRRSNEMIQKLFWEGPFFTYASPMAIFLFDKFKTKDIPPLNDPL